MSGLVVQCDTMTTCKFHAPESCAIREIKSWPMASLFALIERVEDSMLRPETMDAAAAARNIRFYMVDILKSARRSSTIGDVWGMMCDEAIELAVMGYRMGQECEGHYDQSLPCAGAAASRAQPPIRCLADGLELDGPSDDGWHLWRGRLG